MKKIFYRAVGAILIFVLILPGDSFARRRRGPSPYRGLTARSAILADAATARQLYGRNVHSRIFPASTVKVMTALVVMENLALDKVVTVGTRATQAQPSKISVRPGERYRVADLLYAMLLSSANDASIVLAEAVAGSEAKFVQMMNARARQLGAKRTKFSNASGLPSPGAAQYSTAYDMYLIFRQAVKYDFFKKAIQHPYKTISSTDGRTIALKSHNKILFSRDWRRKVYGKTGYTRAAKMCFVGTIQKGQTTLIIAVFGCTRRWEDMKYIMKKYGQIFI